MAAKPPVDYESLAFRGERMVEAHRFFSSQAHEWLTSEGPDKIEARAAAVETVVRELLQMVVIDLGADENAQEIFETLNARGAQLTAADLIKNFIFQRLLESDANVEDAYNKHWKDFESAFWEADISVGRLRYPRSSIFLNHWLIARTGEEVVAREVFSRFKRFAFETDQPMDSLLAQVDRAARVYREFVQTGESSSGPIDRLGLFAYRTSVLESEVIKPLVLQLLDPGQAPIPRDQLMKALEAVESWMVRRMLMRATTKSYSKLIAELITRLSKEDRSKSGDVVEAYLAGQTSDGGYWPDDNEIQDQLRVLPAYRRLSRGRLRMVLEAIEDHRRGWKGDKSALGGERVARGQFAIEHILPREWKPHWPLIDGKSDGEREAIIHTIGNLTLLKSRLNAKVSNGPWLGTNGKRSALEAHDVLVCNRELLKTAGESWTDAAIRRRSDELSKYVIEIWPTPEGHHSGFQREHVAPKHKVDLSDLISAGRLQPGTALYPRRKKFAALEATLLPDGRLDYGGAVFSSPTEAAKAVTGGGIVNGWSFFLVERHPRKSLKDVRIEYLESIAGGGDDEDDAEDDADDDS